MTEAQNWFLLQTDPEILFSYAPKWPLFIHKLAAMFCMTASAIYHLFYVKSPSAMKILARVDYGGISILILGSCIAPYYYCFACGSAIFWRYFYITICTIANVSVFVFSLTDTFNKREYNALRGLSFFFSGIVEAIPIIHL